MTAQKNILYLSYDGLTDPLGQSQVLPYVSGLAQEGYRFRLISFEKPDRYNQFGKSIAQQCADAGIEWKPSSYTKYPPVLSTLWDLWKLRRVISLMQQEEHIDLMHCRSYLTTLVALSFKWKYGIPFIFDMRGFWADERVDGKIWNLKNPVYRWIYNFFKRKEKHFLLEAAAVVSLTHAGKAELPNLIMNAIAQGDADFEKWKKLADTVQSKTTVIPCAADMEHFDYRRITDSDRVQAGIDYDIDIKQEYLGYVGSLGTWYMVKEMVAFYAALLKKEPQVRLLVVSQDEQYLLEKFFAKFLIPLSYLVHRSAPRKDMPVLISLMKASVFFILPVYSKIPSSPTKQGELMGMGIPVICNDGVGDSGEIVRNYESGVVFRNEEISNEELAHTAWLNTSELDQKRIREGGIDYFDLQKGISGYKIIYDGILHIQ